MAAKKIVSTVSKALENWTKVIATIKAIYSQHNSFHMSILCSNTNTYFDYHFSPPTASIPHVSFDFETSWSMRWNCIIKRLASKRYRMKFLMPILIQFIWQKATFPLFLSHRPLYKQNAKHFVIICTISNRKFYLFSRTVQHGTMII